MSRLQTRRRAIARLSRIAPTREDYVETQAFCETSFEGQARPLPVPVPPIRLPVPFSPLSSSGSICSTNHATPRGAFFPLGLMLTVLTDSK